MGRRSTQRALAGIAAVAAVLAPCPETRATPPEPPARVAAAAAAPGPSADGTPAGATDLEPVDAPSDPAARPGAAPPPPEGWHSDLTSALAAAKDSGGLLFVDLFADWCEWCHELEDEVFTTDTFLAFAAEQRLTLLRVDTEDGGEGTVLFSRYSTGGLPTSVVLDADLVRIAAVEGFAPVDQFLERLGAELEAWRALVDHYGQVLAGDDADLQRQLAGDFHARGDAGRAASLYERVLPRVQEGTEAKAWLHYVLADVYRLQRRFDDARAQRDRAQALAAGFEESPELRERIDLLAFYMAQDSGDCPGAVASLEQFLVAHPLSALRGHLRETLETLKRDPLCT